MPGLFDPLKIKDITLRNEKADLVLPAREMLRDPYWPYRAAIALSSQRQISGPGALRPLDLNNSHFRTRLRP